MNLKTVPFLVALLLFVHVGSFAARTRPAPSAGGTPVAGVVLRSYEPNKGTWVAHLANVSHKNVVFVSITVTEYSESGSYYAPTESRPDASSRLNTRFPMRGSDTFPPDTTKDVSLGADARESITPVLGVVVYADDTAEVVNERALEQYLLPIKEKVLTLQKENEILAQFASSPNRVADTVTELLRVASDLPDPHMRNDNDPHVNSEELLSFARELKQNRLDPDDAIKRNADEIEIETKHAQITRITNDQI
jgi:hypothetical protein